jgi:NAD(P)-dependent dehydrogenase (short-subunit alcohol dehydrogenase family)
MEQRVAMVTGASGALGSVLARMASESGLAVAAVDYMAAPKTAPPADVLVLGGVDLSVPAQANAAVDSIVERFGRLDCLFNVAGGFEWRKAEEATPEAWERLYRLNVLTALNAARAALPHLLAGGAGRIVNVGANGALHAGVGMGPYAASKAGVHRLTEALAEEFKGRGLTVNAVLPSIIDTPANRSDMPDADFAKWVQPQDLAAVMLFLASPAAKAITGALTPVVGEV